MPSTYGAGQFAQATAPTGGAKLESGATATDFDPDAPGAPPSGLSVFPGAFATLGVGR